MNILSINHLAKSFSNNTIVLKDISFDVKKGECITIIGSSESSKVKTAITEYEEENNPIIAFINDVGQDDIIRKGAISCYKDEKVLIPLNMADGSLICVGKGNSDWNNSAPHGAGRALSRTRAKDQLTMKEYKEQMKNIFSTCVSISTLDEAPMAYKNSEEIINAIEPTAEIIDHLKPLYNFKAEE